MQLYNGPAARPLVQAVHVLCHEDEIRDEALELGQRPVTSVRLGLHHEVAPPLVPLPHQPGISGERLGGREILRVVALPETCLGLAEGRDPTLGRDAGSGQGDDVPGVAQGLDQVQREPLHGRGSTRDGPEQLLRPVRYGNRAFLARRHVPHRTHSPSDLVLPQNGCVGCAAAVSLPELALRAAIRVVEVAGDAL